MAEDSPSFEAATEVETATPTLIEGLPGLGLVGAIAADLIADELGLRFYGSVVSDTLPRVASYGDGLLRDPVRVSAGTDPSVLVLRSDIALPPRSHSALADIVLGDLAADYERAIFPVGAPAETEDEVGSVTGVATTDALRAELVERGIDPAERVGLIGGATGALLTECYRAGVPAIALVVKARPFRPDPAAARALVDDGLEPLVPFGVDTAPLDRRADAIEAEMGQMARQMQEMIAREGVGEAPPEPSEPSMYQ